MEMAYYRNVNFKPPRAYLPWDPLQLDENIHGGWRPNKNEVLFHEFKLYHRTLHWIPLFYKSQMYFYDNFTQLKSSLDNLMRRNQRLSPGTCVFEAYSFDREDNEYNEFLQELDNHYFFMHYHPYHENFEHFIKNLIDYRQMIRDKTRRSKLLEPTSKRLQFFILKLDDKTLDELNGDMLLKERLKNLIEKSTDERMYFFIYADKAERLPKDLILASDFNIFIGDENEEYCSNVLYPNYKKRGHYISRVVYGVAVTSRYEEVMPLHSTKRTEGRSKWVTHKKAEAIDEARIYQEFLDSLDDGSELDYNETYSWENIDYYNDSDIYE